MTHKLLPRFLISTLLCAVFPLSAALIGPWTGAVTETRAVIKAEVNPEETTFLELSPNANFRRTTRIALNPKGEKGPENFRQFDLTNLKPATRYFYRIVGEQSGTEASRTGSFTTLPVEGKPASFSFTLGSCSRTGSENPVYTRILEAAPLFHLITGDIHYENVNAKTVEPYRAAYAKVLASQPQAALYRTVPIAYVWDDHDFCGDNSTREYLGRPNAIQAYKEFVPHYPLQAPEGSTTPITQKFAVGRCLFIVLDLRSQRDDPDAPDNSFKTMLGAWQKKWLKETLLDARDKYGLIFVVSSVSWISDEKRGDNWGRYVFERRELAKFFAENGLTSKLCFLSGDAHMLAADDGTNSNYAESGDSGFPCIQAASLDQRASVKGGPYSHGISLPGPNQGQFGRIEVTDRDGQITVNFSGQNSSGEDRLRMTFKVDAPVAK